MKFKLFLIIVVISIGIAFLLPKKQSNIKDIIAKGTEISRQSIFEQFNVYDDSISSLDQLEEASDAILKVQFMSRVQYQYVSKSKCKILEISKDNSNTLKVNDEVYVFELFSVSNRGIALQMPFTPMNEDREYYVFLKRVKDYNDPIYNLSSDFYGMYPVAELTIKTIKNTATTSNYLDSDDEKNTGEFLYVFEEEIDYKNNYSKIYREVKEKFK